MENNDKISNVTVVPARDFRDPTWQPNTQRHSCTHLTHSFLQLRGYIFQYHLRKSLATPQSCNLRALCEQLSLFSNIDQLSENAVKFFLFSHRSQDVRDYKIIINLKKRGLRSVPAIGWIPSWWLLILSCQFPKRQVALQECHTQQVYFPSSGLTK